MATNKLFGYSIEENEGKLVITVDGVYAQAAIDNLRSEIGAGRGWGALSQLSPIGGLNRMARRAAQQQRRIGAISAMPEMPDDDEAQPPDGEAELDLGTIFNQGFADTYEGFSKRLDRYGASLAQLEKEFQSDQGSKAASSPAGTAATPERGTPMDKPAASPSDKKAKGS